MRQNVTGHHMKYYLPLFALWVFSCNPGHQATDKRIEDLTKLATAADSVQDLTAAIDYYSKILAIDPTNLLALNNRGRALVWTGEYDKGLADYDKAIALYPHEGTYYTRAIVYVKLNRFDRAWSDLRKSIQLNPDFGKAYYGVSLLYETKNELDSALLFCDFADTIAYLPEYSHSIRLSIFRKQGDFESALNEVNKVLKADSMNADAYNDRGMIKNKLERYDEALADFDTSIRLNSRMAYAYNNKAFSLLKLNQPDKALLLVNQSLEIDSTNAFAWKNRAEVFIALNSQDKACMDLTQAEKLAEDKELVEEIEALVNSVCKTE